MTEPKDFSDMFDQDGNVLVGEVTATDAPPTPPVTTTPTATYTMNNNNMEVGAELNLFFKTATGFKGHLQLHAPTGREVLEQSAGALAYLSSTGCVPEHSTAATPTEPTREDLPQDGTAASVMCTIHNVEMKRRTSKFNDDVWYSHQTDDPAYKDKDGWCRGPK